MGRTTIVTAGTAIRVVAFGASAAALSSAAMAQDDSLSGSLHILMSAGQQPGLELLMDRFRAEHPDIEVSAEYLPGGSEVYTTTLLTQFQAGAGPDVFFAFSGSGGPSPALFTLVAADYVESLAGSSWLADEPDWIRPFNDVDGTPYKLQQAAQTNAVLYNVDKFEELGLEVPKTQADLVELCQKVEEVAPGTIPIAFAAGNPAVAGINATMFAISDVYLSDPNWNEQRTSGETTFAESGWRTALNRLVDLKDANCFSPAAVSDQVPDNTAQMASGMALMEIGTTGAFGQARFAGEDINFSMFVMPATDAESSRLLAFISGGLSINARSDNLEAAHAFVDFAGQKEQVDAYNEANNGGGDQAPGNFISGDLPAIYDPIRAEMAEAVPAPFFQWPTPATFNALSVGVQGLLTGQKTVDDVLTDMDASWGS